MKRQFVSIGIRNEMQLWNTFKRLYFPALFKWAPDRHRRYLQSIRFDSIRLLDWFLIIIVSMCSGSHGRYFNIVRANLEQVDTNK